MTLRRLLIIVCALGSCAAGCGSSAATPSTRTYASGLTHAAAFAFDAQSRLWVATAAYKDDGTDGVYLVPAAGAAPVEVIRGLHTPLGLLWLRGELYVASKERVDAYSGLVHNRFTKHRTVLTLPRGVGESNNLVLAPDGRLLLGISAPCDHCVPKSKYSAAIVSFTTTGRDLRVYARDIRAPVGLAFLNGKLYVTIDRKSTRLNSSHRRLSRMPSSA